MDQHATISDIHSNGIVFCWIKQAAYIHTAASGVMSGVRKYGGYVGNMNVSTSVGNAAIKS